jgi:hypothetical protein
MQLSKDEPATVVLDSVHDWFSFIENLLPISNQSASHSNRYRIIFRDGMAALMYGGVGESPNSK